MNASIPESIKQSAAHLEEIKQQDESCSDIEDDSKEDPPTLENDSKS
jgi:hypothetical protein